MADPVGGRWGRDHATYYRAPHQFPIQVIGVEKTIAPTLLVDDGPMTIEVIHAQNYGFGIPKPTGWYKKPTRVFALLDISERQP